MIRSAEHGSSSLAAVFGIAIFLGFLLLASQVLIHLYATSTVTTVAFDAAGRAARAGGDCGEELARARAALGGWGRRAELHCDPADGEHTTVTITGPSPAAGLRLYARSTGMDTLRRSASVRTEEFVP